MLKKVIALCLATNLVATGGIASAQELLIQPDVSSQETNDGTVSQQSQTEETIIPSETDELEASSGLEDSNVIEEPDNSPEPAEDGVSTQQQITDIEETQEQQGVEGSAEVGQQQSTNVQNEQQQHADDEAMTQTEVNQAQTVDAITNQSQAVVGGFGVEQSQWTSNYSDILQIVQISQKRAEQAQAANLQAGQIQAASAVGEAALNQEQDLALRLARFQQFISGEYGIEQAQNIAAATDQVQYVETGIESIADIIQGQEAGIIANQTADISDVVKESQQAEVISLQLQGIQTSGPTLLGQQQQVDVEGENASAAESVQVKSNNILHVFSRAAQTFVQFVQEIYVNGNTETVESEYELGTEDISQEQLYSYCVEILCVNVANYASVGKIFNTDQMLASMASFISIVFSPIDILQDIPDDIPEDIPTNTPDNSEESPKEEEPVDIPDAPAAETPQDNSSGDEMNPNGETQSVHQDEDAGVLQVQDTNAASSSDSAVVEGGQEVTTLPDTATNTFNSLLMGVCLLVISGCLYMFRRKNVVGKE